MEGRESKTPSPGEKISIIDLVVVLLKHRRIIVGIVASVFFAALIGYFFLPAYQFKHQPDREERESEVAITMAVSLAPGAGYFLPTRQCGYFFRKPGIVIEALEKSNIISSREKTGGWILPISGAYLDANKEGKIYKSPNGKLTVKEYSETGVVEFVFLSAGAEQGISFLNSLFSLGSQATDAYIKSLAEKSRGFSPFRFPVDSVEAFDIFLDPSVVEPGPETGNALKRLADFQKTYRARALMLVLAALFFSIFLAFFINAITDIKNDKESINKIRSVFNP